MTFSTYFSPGVALQGGGGSGGGGAASAPLTGTGATVTTSQPLINVSQTWNNAAVTFTGMQFNAAGTSDANSAAASLLMDLQVGGASKFSVQKNGYVKVVFATVSSGASELNLNYYQPGFGVSSTGQFTFSSTASASGPDTFLTRRGAANLRLGEADTGTTSATVTITIAVPGVVTWASHGLTTGSPVSFTTTGALPTGIVSGTIYYAVVVTTSTIQLASSSANAVAATPTVITTTGTQSGVHTGARNAITQRLGVQSVTGVTDRPGADKIITGSQGTGTGAGGSLIFQVAPAGSSGSAQNALATALTITSTGAATFSSTVAGAQFRQNGSSGAGINCGANGSRLVLASNNTDVAYLSGDNITFNSTTLVSWSSTSSTSGSYDLALARDDANKLALKNGANAQEFRVYETTTGTIYKAILGNRQLMKIAGAAFDNGAGASAGTLANAPAVGNPTKWIPIDDNGTTRYIPAW